jgi:hypothetical protein
MDRDAGKVHCLKVHLQWCNLGLLSNYIFEQILLLDLLAQEQKFKLSHFPGRVVPGLVSGFFVTFFIIFYVRGCRYLLCWSCTRIDFLAHSPIAPYSK